MQPLSRSLIRPTPRQPLSPAERYLIGHTTLMLVVFSWAGGGRLAWSPAALFVGAVLGLPAVWLQAREEDGLRLRGFVPFACWLGLLGVELLNPSHVHDPGAGWLPRSGWIPWLPTTVDRELAVRAALPWLAALLEGGIFATMRPSARVTRVIWTVAALNGFLLAAVGAAFRFAQAGEMLGFIAVPDVYFFATFFYKNHWAAYGALCAWTGIVLALGAWDRARPGDPRARGRLVFFTVISLLTAVTLPLAGSRSGALFAIALAAGWLGGLLFGLRSEQRYNSRQRALIAALLIASAALIVSYGASAYGPRARTDMERTVRQLSQATRGESADLRWLVSSDTWRMAKERLWFGWGLGSFEVVFPHFQGPYLRGTDGQPDGRVEFAHDDWLQALAESGVVGLAILLFPAVRLAARAWRRSRSARRMVLGCAVIAAYAWIDFPFNNPAILLLWTLLLVTASPAARPEQAVQSWVRA